MQIGNNFLAPEQTTVKRRENGTLQATLRYSLDIAGVVQACLEAWLNVVPGALVLVFFLSPDDFSVGIFGAFGFHQVVWEG
jgi:hypothetical protein